jgi:hypothetical protein
MAAGVTPKLWSLTDMVRVIEDWETAATRWSAEERPQHSDKEAKACGWYSKTTIPAISNGWIIIHAAMF